MNVLFVTENSPQLQRVDHSHPNLRTDLAWMAALDATHANLGFFQHPHRLPDYLSTQTFSVAVMILPKLKSGGFVDLRPYVQNVKLNFPDALLCIMQEGPHWYFQDYPVEEQLQHIECLAMADLLLCHNESDVFYFHPFATNAVEVMPTVMFPRKFPKPNRQGAIVGGNLTSWYSGIDSWKVAMDAGIQDITFPSMGRVAKGEELLVANSAIKKIPYSDMDSWLSQLNNFKYGIHLMRTYAAGSFALNCASLKIPCVGYESIDTQANLFPTLTCPEGDLYTAIKYLSELQADPHEYDVVAESAYQLFLTSLHHPDNFTPHMHMIFSKHIEKLKNQ